MKTQVITLNTHVVNLQPKTIKAKENHIKKTSLSYVVAFALIALFTTLSQSAYAAGPLNPVQLANEVMMHAQGEDGQVIASRIGVDPNSPLNYSTHVDPAGRSFTFSLTSGSTYLGQPITLSAAGTLNPSTQTWSISSYASYGATRWTVTTSLVPSVSADTSTISYTSRTQVGSDGLQPLTVTHPWDGKVCWPVFGYFGYGWSLEQCQYYWEGQPVGQPWTDYDGWGPWSPYGPWYPWWWALNLEPFGYSLSIQGSTPKGGGDGFSATLVGPARSACVNCSVSDGSQ